MKKLQSAFPRQDPLYFNILAERVIANGFTDMRLADAVNHVIDNFQYKELNISDIVRFDKKRKLYTYREATAMVTKGQASFGEDLKRIEIDGKSYWVNVNELL